MGKKDSFLTTLWEGFKSLLYLPQVQELLVQLLLKALKLQALGGVRGWLIRKLAIEFTEEVIEIITTVGDYEVSKKELKDINSQDDRDDVADSVNDWMR